jgi:hypothetical protein
MIKKLILKMSNLKIIRIIILNLRNKNVLMACQDKLNYMAKYKDKFKMKNNLLLLKLKINSSNKNIISKNNIINLLKNWKKLKEIYINLNTSKIFFLI